MELTPVKLIDRYRDSYQILITLQFEIYNTSNYLLCSNDILYTIFFFFGLDTILLLPHLCNLKSQLKF